MDSRPNSTFGLLAGKMDLWKWIFFLSIGMCFPDRVDSVIMVLDLYWLLSSEVSSIFIRFIFLLVVRK